MTRTGNENLISLKLLHHCIRKELDENTPRIMAVLDPVLLILTNLENDQELEIPYHPK